MSLLIPKNHALPIRTDRQIIRMRHDERLLITEHNPNRSKRLGVHQAFDLISDHRGEVSRIRDEGKMETANDERRELGSVRVPRAADGVAPSASCFALDSLFGEGILREEVCGATPQTARQRHALPIFNCIVPLRTVARSGMNYALLPTAVSAAPENSRAKRASTLLGIPRRRAPVILGALIPKETDYGSQFYPQLRQCHRTGNRCQSFRDRCQGFFAGRQNFFHPYRNLGNRCRNFCDDCHNPGDRRYNPKNRCHNLGNDGYNPGNRCHETRNHCDNPGNGRGILFRR
jgi:hypothetical protein